jgi:hypothetical protein
LISGSLDLTESEILYSDKFDKKAGTNLLINVDSTLNINDKVFDFSMLELEVFDVNQRYFVMVNLVFRQILRILI